MNRDFNTWLNSFRDNIADYAYYVDFEKVYRNTDTFKIELNILNSLIGSKDIENDFLRLVDQYPQIMKCIPILLAKRSNEIQVTDETGVHHYNFHKMNHTPKQYCLFMEKTGLFDLIGNHIINNLVDYVSGVEVGLDSNARKNRGGHLMENLVEQYIVKEGFVKGISYFKEMTLSEIEKKWHVNLSAISNNGKAEKRFDFVIKTDKQIYGIETNFYTSSGSKLNETARSYKTIALEAAGLDCFTFVWFTDGLGWKNAKRNLEETFDVLDTLFNITDMENGVIRKLFIR